MESMESFPDHQWGLVATLGASIFLDWGNGSLSILLFFVPNLLQDFLVSSNQCLTAVPITRLFCFAIRFALLHMKENWLVGVYDSCLTIMVSITFSHVSCGHFVAKVALSIVSNSTPWRMYGLAKSYSAVVVWLWALRQQVTGEHCSRVLSLATRRWTFGEREGWSLNVFVSWC